VAVDVDINEDVPADETGTPELVTGVAAGLPEHAARSTAATAALTPSTAERVRRSGVVIEMPSVDEIEGTHQGGSLPGP
jgi:methyl coenzyme M reductase subunit C